MIAPEPTPTPVPERRRFVSLLVVFVLGAALVGFLHGIQEPPPLARPASAAPPPGPRARTAPSYTDLLNGRPVPYPAVGPFDPVVRTDAAKLAAIADRAKTRAFDGAPPVIPHPTDGMTGAASCLACHGTGLNLGERVAQKVSHPHFTNCTQCHVAGGPPELARFADPEPVNGFAGTPRAGPGSRAAPGAPPTIPHPTWLRQDCTSCHGLAGRPGLRTTHPWLTNCTQCHAPSAALDQVAFPLPPNGGGP